LPARRALPALLFASFIAASTAPPAAADPFAEVLTGVAGAAAPRVEGATSAWWAAVQRRMAAGSPAWTGESDQASAEFGGSVATAGDVNGDGYGDVIVGAHFYTNGQSFEGRVFVYHGSAAGLALSPAWSAEGDQTQADFGYSVATAGDVNGDGYSDVIVGARAFDAGQSDEGRAFVYHGSASGLNAAPAWTAEGDQASAWFGYSVAPAGDVNGDGFSDVIVGAPAFDAGQTNEGRAFVYLGSAAGLAATPAWTTEADVAGAQLGASVATAGDVNGDGYSDVIVGANLFSNGQSNEGRALVHHGSPGGPSAAPSWSFESDQSSAFLGQSVATAGDVNGDGFSDVIVGAPYYDAGETDEGRAFVFHGSASGLAAAPAWTAEGDQAGAHFAHAVAPLGDANGDGYGDVIVGALDHDGGETNEGRVSVWRGGPAGLEVLPAWTAESDQIGARLGVSVATAGDVDGDGLADALAGAGLFDAGQANEGRAFVWHGATGLPAGAALWSFESDSYEGEFGYAVAPAGDVNGDGFGDVIVGSRSHTAAFFREGRVSVFHGSADGLGLAPAWVADGGFGDARLGGSVGGAGDVNGDGYADVIAGARLHNGVGRAYVWYGSPAGLGAAPAWIAEGTQAGASFGGWVAGAGDVNGDGFADVIVGAFHFDDGETDEGRAYVYHGSAAGLAASPAWTANGDQAEAYFGHPVASAGDVNGDGYGDVIVGAPYFNVAFGDEGRALVYHGSPAGLAPVPAWVVDGEQWSSRFGQTAAGAGDVNGDGFSDVIVGALYFGAEDEGRASVYPGSAGGLSTAPGWTLDGTVPYGGFAYSVASAGDVDADGFSDVLVGAVGPGFDPLGQVHVFRGSPGGPGAAPDWTVGSPQAGAYFGACVASAGDVDGDGFGDVIVGAAWYDGPTFHEGLARVYHGNGGAARLTLPRQVCTDSVTPIVPLGRSDSETAFRIRAIMLSAWGRTRLQMEHEVKPTGVPFDGAGTTFGAFFDIGNDGLINFNRLVSGLEPATAYHWRVRAKYDLARTPFQRNGPWVHLPARGWNEADLRTDGTSLVDVPLAGAARTGSGLALLGSGPNPAVGRCEVLLALDRRARVRADVLDVAGRRVTTLVRDEEIDPGRRVLAWDGRAAAGAPAAAGVYFVRVRAGDEERVRKAILLR